MSRSTRIITTSVSVGMLLAGALASPAQAAAESTSWTVDGIEISGIPALAPRTTPTRSDVLAYVATNQTQITSDPHTGDIVAVAPVDEQARRISERNNCGSGDARWQAAAVPYANNCFYGTAGVWTFPKTGTKSSEFRTGKYSASGAWVTGGKTVWGFRQGPGSVNALTAVADVKGAQIR